MNTKLLGAALGVALLFSPLVRAAAQDHYVSVVEYDNYTRHARSAYPVYDAVPIAATGVITRVNQDGDRLIIRTDRNRRYLVDAYNAEVITPDARTVAAQDLSTGDRVRITGSLLGVRLIEAGRVVVLGDYVEAAPPIAEMPAPVAPPPAPLVVPPPVVVVPAPVYRGDAVTLEVVVTSVVTDQDQVFALGDDDKTYRIKADDADIIIPGVDRAGTLADLSRGARIKVIGSATDGGSIIHADRIRVIGSDAPAAAPPPPTPQPLDLSQFTGVLIDVRVFEAIQRSPNPAVYDSEMNLLYPDRSHVPSPDEVQNESTVRYYRTVDDAFAGVGGTRPLILRAEMIVGPAQDGIMLDANDAALFKALDQRLGYTKNWKVGFLIPGDR